MTPTHRVARTLAGLTGTAALALACAAPAALATPRPEPPGYYKHPPLPVTHTRIHTVFVGGTPEWKMILIAAAAALLGAAFTLLLNGPALPGRPRPDDPQPTAHPADPSRNRPDSDGGPPLTPGVQSAHLPERTGPGRPEIPGISRHR